VNMQDLPLLELFTRLRKADVPLGIDEYQLLLRALQGGFGVADRAALKRLCQTLWVKSADDHRLFDYHFEQVIPRSAGNRTPTRPLEPLPEQQEISPGTPVSLPMSETDESISSPISDLEPIPMSQMTVKTDDEIRVAQAVLQTAGPGDGLTAGRYLFSSDEYFPVTRRQMKQSWRYLRRMAREGPPVELDVEITIDEFARKGMLLEPRLVPLRINCAELLLLIDHGGSMVPFHVLSHRLVETALRGGRLGRVDIYYFHNCPVEYLYCDPDQQEYERIDDILKRLSERTGILILSDAGAARGGLSQERVDVTEHLLQQFEQRLRYIAWLNPMPRSRWPGTSAGKIMRSIPMFDLSRRGFDDAISVLRGRSTRVLQGTMI
jgi:uncharacterized protein